MKKDFYIYQEDLINYEITTNEITITDLVMDLNCKLCMDGMKKLRTEAITNYLQSKGYLEYDQEKRKKKPTILGNLLGIDVRRRFNKERNIEYDVNVYDRNAQKYILDNLYKII